MKLRLSYFMFLLGFLGACGAETVTFEQGKQKRDLTPKEQSDRRQKNAESKGVMTLSFQAGQKENITMTYDASLGLIEQNLAMVQKPLTKMEYVQLERDLTPLSFTQGHHGDLIREEFAAIEAGKVDILIVVDDSETMTTIQDALSRSLPELLRHIKDLNWQIAINTTSSPCLRATRDGVRILSKSQYDKDPSSVIDDYRELIRVGNSGSNFETGILSAADGMQGLCPRGDYQWRRDDAKPVALIVSDEKNCGSDSREGCLGEPHEKGDYLTDKVPDVRVYGLLLLTQYADDCPEIGGYDDFYPQNYIDLINDTGGIYDSICQVNYDTVMGNISRDVSEQVVKKFLLSYEPSSKPELFIDGVAVANRFVLQGKVLEMVDSLPLSATTLAVSYRHGAIAFVKSYQLSGNPDPRSLKVRVGNTTLTEKDYTFEASPPLLTLHEMPKAKAKIDISFRENTPLDNSFAILESAVLESLEVLVDGQKQIDFAVDKETYQLSFPLAPLDGKKIEILFEKPNDKTLIYQVEGVSSPLAIESMSIKDAKTGEDVVYEREDSSLIFPYDEVQIDREVLVSYKVTYTKEELYYEVPLSHPPIEGSLKAASDDGLESCKIEGYKEQKVMIQCIDDEFENIQIDYDYEVGYVNNFDLEFPFRDLLVYVNGSYFENFELSLDRKNLMIQKEDLPIGSSVKVVLSL